MKTLLCIFLILSVVRPALGGPGIKARNVLRLEAPGMNAHYMGNRSPLLPLPLVKLPLGAVKPEGWLRLQVRGMADGFSGHLMDISKWCRFEGSAWASSNGEGEYPWEELPYWLRGYVDLGYVAQDKRIVKEATRWVERLLASQDSTGYFGPRVNRAKHDIWPNMVALCAVRSHYEATRDPRVLPFMVRYFRWLYKEPIENLLPESWQKIRGGDNLDHILWVYNETGEPWLLDLARRNHERTSDWTNGIPSWHGVNICQSFREPAEFYQQSLAPSDLRATERNYDSVMNAYGQVPGGMFGADENAREGYAGPRQGAETCSMAELMFSDQMLTRITGNTAWADRCEDVAFNSLPAAFTPDLKGLHYLTAPNMVQLDSANKAPMFDNDGDMLTYNPWRYRCCQHNAAFGWPYFTENLWMATADNGVAAAMYAPCTVTAVVANGVKLRVKEETAYPFEETVRLSMTLDRGARFPLVLRVPGWCEGATVAVNGKPVELQAKPGSWIVLERDWRNGDLVRLELPARIVVRTWAKNRNGVSVDRGPLTYSLRIGEQWKRLGGTDAWPAFELFPSTAWNYALAIGSGGAPGQSFRLERRALEPSAQPFTVENAPLILHARGQRLPDWKLEANGLIGELPMSPVSSGEKEETIALVPMGCARLRVSMFPRVR